MRAFVAVRHMTLNLPQDVTSYELVQLRKDFEELKRDVEDILQDQNNINEDTRAQLDAISMALAELQARKPVKKAHGIYSIFKIIGNCLRLHGHNEMH